MSKGVQTPFSLWDWLGREVRDFRASIRDLPVMEKVGPERIRDRLRSRFRFRSAMDAETVTREVSEMIRQWNVHVTHPRYFGLFNPSVHEIAVAADALAALYNPQLAVWSHAPAAAEIERHTLDHLKRAAGLDPETMAHFTSGGCEANLSAVLAALAWRFPETGETGLMGLSETPTIYVSSETHHSMVKIARMSGLGTRALRQVGLDGDLRLDPADLERRIVADAEAGFRPLMVVGTAGTTAAGLVDPLDHLADVAERHGLWFHVDGAWGASALLSPRLRDELRGVERADSLTWDAHKWLSVPMGAGMFFCRRPDAVRRAFAVTATYMPAKTRGDLDDAYTVSAQWSRRVIGLKVFMTLASTGLDGLAQLIEGQADMGECLRQKLQDAGWTVVHPTALPVICFTHPDIEAGRFRTSEVLKKIYRRARVWISDVILDAGEADIPADGSVRRVTGKSRRALRACITSFQTDAQDLDVLIDELETVRRELVDGN